MNKVNPFSWSRPVTSVKQFEFSDPRYPDQPVRMTLRSMDTIDGATIRDVAMNLMAEYAGKPFPAIDGKFIEIGETLATQAAEVFVLQETSDDTSKYSLEELIVFMVVSPIIWGAIRGAIAELMVNSELGKLINLQPSSPD